MEDTRPRKSDFDRTTFFPRNYSWFVVAEQSRQDRGDRNGEKESITDSQRKKGEWKDSGRDTPVDSTQRVYLTRLFPCCRLLGVVLHVTTHWHCVLWLPLLSSCRANHRGRRHFHYHFPRTRDKLLYHCFTSIQETGEFQTKVPDPSLTL